MAFSWGVCQKKVRIRGMWMELPACTPVFTHTHMYLVFLLTSDPVQAGLNLTKEDSEALTFRALF